MSIEGQSEHNLKITFGDVDKKCNSLIVRNTFSPLFVVDKDFAIAIIEHLITEFNLTTINPLR